MSNKKLFSALLLATSVIFAISCNNSNVKIVPNTVATLSSYSANVAKIKGVESPIVQNQIKSNTLSQNEWGVEVKELPNANSSKKVTLLSYLAFDNDKGGWRKELKPVINAHEYAGSASNINLVLQTDGLERQDMKRYYIVNDDNDTLISSPYTKFKYERNSSDYRVLQAFIRWGFSTYKSEIKILDINSHGASFYGVAMDETSRGSISLPNLSTAIKSAAGTLDILTFDACLMATVETAYELKDNANVMIGSEDATLETSMMYVKNIDEIIGKSKNPEEIARNIALSSDRKGTLTLESSENKKGKLPNIFTVSVFRGGQYIGNSVSELNNLSNLLLKKMPQYKTQIKTILDGTHSFYLDNGSSGNRDIYEILERMATIIQDKEIQDSIVKVRTALNKTILISRAHNIEKYAKGLAININPQMLKSPKYQETKFAKETLWDEFIIEANK